MAVSGFFPTRPNPILAERPNFETKRETGASNREKEQDFGHLVAIREFD
jgi:hypothetical protein